MNRSAQWRLLSDVHLGLTDDDPRHPGKVLPEFLDGEVATGTGTEQHVIFVGDTFELVNLPERESLARLEDLLDLHSDVFNALRTSVRRGVRLHFLCGNHDVELARPAVAARLSALLSPADPTRVTVHPWLLHVPHVLLAEHGHLHHPLHRIPEVLRTAVSGTDGLNLPPLAAFHADPSRSRLGHAAVVARACLASEQAERRIRSHAYDQLLQAESRQLGLDSAIVRELARLSRFRTVSALPVAAARMVRAAAGQSIAIQKAPAAASRTARILAAGGSKVAWYVSAHTHRALESALEDSSTRYINTGTWSSDIRGQGPDQSDREAFPYALIAVDDDGATGGGLRYWRRNAA